MNDSISVKFKVRQNETMAFNNAHVGSKTLKKKKKTKLKIKYSPHKSSGYLPLGKKIVIRKGSHSQSGGLLAAFLFIFTEILTLYRFRKLYMFCVLCMYSVFPIKTGIKRCFGTESFFSGLINIF